MYIETPTKQFKKDYKKVKRQGKNKNKLRTVIDELRQGHVLAEQYKDHELTNNWKGCRECHIQPDWLLIYKIDKTNNRLYLMRTGSHSELLESLEIAIIHIKQLNEQLEQLLKES